MDGQKFKITTPQGEIIGVLYNETPIHRDNFIKLINEGFYDGLLFHRVIQGFMIQGGDPESKGSPSGAPLGSGGPGYTLQAEISPQFIHKKGALAAARTGDQVNPRRESSGSQFYIVQGKPVAQEELDNKGIYTEEQMAIYKKVGGTPMLDAQYTVFGEVIEGLDVIDKIAAVQKDRSDRPINNVVMKIELINE
ncbi:MAG: peptidylprolyl isomerase [Bacteroidales bacterium]|nr:peptidylprolyl isomerase [Bacteroidales bacterium]